MGAHVDRYVINRDRQVGTVIEVVASQKILVGFTLAAMLRDDQPRYRFQASPGRVTGRAFRSSPLTVNWLAMLGAPAGPEPTFGAPDEKTAGGAAGAAAVVEVTDSGVRASRVGD
jgi:hypothetical protein